MPVDYTFKAPSNWNPQIMPPISLQLAISALGIKPQVDMNQDMNFGPPPVHINPPIVNVSPPKANLALNVSGPSVGIKVN
jgi:hypothetical protein